MPASRPWCGAVPDRLPPEPRPNSCVAGPPSVRPIITPTHPGPTASLREKKSLLSFCHSAHQPVKALVSYPHLSLLCTCIYVSQRPPRPFPFECHLGITAACPSSNYICEAEGHQSSQVLYQQRPVPSSPSPPPPPRSPPPSSSTILYCSLHGLFTGTAMSLDQHIYGYELPFGSSFWFPQMPPRELWRGASMTLWTGCSKPRRNTAELSMAFCLPALHHLRDGPLH